MVTVVLSNYATELNKSWALLFRPFANTLDHCPIFLVRTFEIWTRYCPELGCFSFAGVQYCYSHYILNKFYIKVCKKCFNWESLFNI